MNIIIFLLGLFFIVVVSIIILIEKKDIMSTMEKEMDLAEDANIVSTEQVESKAYFENVLNNASNNHEVLENRIPLSSSSDKDFALMDANSNDSNFIVKQERVKDNSQNHTYERIIELHNSGLQPGEIAKITQKGIREVEIVLKFRNKTNNP
ncbi:MAG: hypothetical protein WDA24_03210 [Tissierellales bacterium]